ncbi:MAG: hypothetical protein ACLFPL_05440 [Candidatus Nanoarchaeia archaeon]
MNKDIWNKRCEICQMTNGGLNPLIGNHFVCEYCLKKLKILKFETIKKRIANFKNTSNSLNLQYKSYKDHLLEERNEYKKKIVYIDIILEKIEENNLN